jgi:hypothetical protein
VEAETRQQKRFNPGSGSINVTFVALTERIVEHPSIVVETLSVRSIVPKKISSWSMAKHEHPGAHCVTSACFLSLHGKGQGFAGVKVDLFRSHQLRHNCCLL